MNSCVLMAKVVRDPQLRYTQDNQTPVAEMLVEFAGLGPNDSPSTLKVVGWGNLATQFPEAYHSGDELIIEGRLSMRVIERPEGFKEKRAELVASRIHPLNSNGFPPPPSSEKVVTMEDYKMKSAPEPFPDEETSFNEMSPLPQEEVGNLDDIPF